MTRLEDALANALGAQVEASASVAGGDINEALRIDLADGRRVFLKHHAGADPRMFPAEADGLAWLADAGALRVPRVLALGLPRSGEAPARTCPTVPSAVPFLAMEWLEPGRPGPRFDEELGRGLADVHRAGGDRFGLAADNFLATLPQENAPEPDWPTFYARRRLAPLLRRAVAAGLAPPDWPSAFERLYARLPELAGPPEPPARLHGDLWSGNVHCDAAGKPCLIDPAVYGGHREVDLAMLSLFGSPSRTFFDAYDEVWPLAQGWRERLPLWQLYPLLAHVNLFGGGYVGGVDSRLRALLR